MPLLDLVVALFVVAVVAWLIKVYVPMPDDIRPIVNIVVALLVVGMALWLINTYVPMAGTIKMILNIVVVGVTCVRVLQAVGLWRQVLRLWINLTRHRISH
jgi:hypothetical protein